MSLDSRIKKLEQQVKSVEEEKETDFSAATTEELEYMVSMPVEQWETDQRCIEIYSKIKWGKHLTHMTDEELDRKMMEVI